MTRTASLALVAALTAASLSACGLAPETSARPLPAPPTTGPATSNAVPQVSAVTWLTRGDQLTRVLRQVPSGGSSTVDVDAATLLAELIKGPTPAERRRNVGTALADGDVTALADPLPTPPGRLLVSRIAVSPSLQGKSADEQVLAIGQVVLTLTSNGFDAVVFVGEDGQPVAVPGPDNTILEGEVDRDDYASLAVRR